MSVNPDNRVPQRKRRRVPFTAVAKVRQVALVSGLFLQ
jgi:hypothetical protein